MTGGDRALRRCCARCCEHSSVQTDLWRMRWWLLWRGRCSRFGLAPVGGCFPSPAPLAVRCQCFRCRWCGRRRSRCLVGPLPERRYRSTGAGSGWPDRAVGKRGGTPFPRVLCTVGRSVVFPLSASAQETRPNSTPAFPCSTSYAPTTKSATCDPRTAKPTTPAPFRKLVLETGCSQNGHKHYPRATAHRVAVEMFPHSYINTC